MTLKDLLVERGLTTALIIDDAYDEVPRAEDLSDDEDIWANFIDDIGASKSKILKVFPDYDAFDGPALRQSNEFVAAIWSLREQLQSDLWHSLFESYEQGIRTDREFLERLESELQSLGITAITGGRTLPANAHDASIVFADLFLGSAQQDPDMERSIASLVSLLAGKVGDPPLVILMSRSPLLGDKKASFRDRARLPSTMFRFYSKRELLEGANLSRALERLALHRPDAIRVSEFIQAWERGLSVASERFMRVIRRLDLSDYAQIREVLLNFEGQPLGSYLLDVFDRVLQHEMEADAATIGAAAALNEIDPKRYPAPHIAGSTDLQDLVYRTMWQHPRRLAVKNTTAGAPVSFGDVMITRALVTEQPTGATGEPDALVVLTPGCDLMRSGGAKRVMMMAGTCAPLTPKTWTYKGGGLRTAILVLPNERRVWIHWDKKDIRTMLPSEVMALCAATGAYSLFHRFREGYALELQQHLLADMGRVAQLSPMPATFPVRIQCSYFDPEKRIRTLDLPITEREGGVCYTGRDAKGEENTRLVVTEDVADELVSTIAGLREEAIHSKAHQAFGRLKISSFSRDLEGGLEVPSATSQSWQAIMATVVGEGGNESQVAVGLVARNPIAESGDVQRGAIMLAVWDSEPPVAPKAAADLIEGTAPKTHRGMPRDDE